MPPISNDSFAVNPFTLVFDGLWDLLEKCPMFAAELGGAVALNNRIHLNRTSDSNPLKQQINDSDLPEVILIPSGIARVNTFANSSSSMIAKRYTWLISTGDIRVNNIINQVEWAIYIGMIGWQTKLSSLIWPLNSGKTFVKKCDLAEADEGLDQGEQNRGIRGWAAVWTCEVEMWFETSDLKNLLGY